jgi:hypothetical protein
MDAIRLDQAEVEEAIRLQALLTNPSPTEIQIYKMDEPTEKPPLTICKYSKGLVLPSP